ncbi:MAG TPA: MobF family relaxase [Acetobacteraceae bacterium]|nr:MobF family relaxase [Acetobacteraceae bacterium]
MLTFRAGAAGSAGVARKMADHLITQTLPATAQDLATYYQRGITAGAAIDGQDHAQATDAVQPGMAPEPRRDMDPRLATLLGLDLSRPPTRDEIACLLAGSRTDGAKIEGKQYQKATLPLSQIFGVDPMRLPTRDELAHVLAGRRADGSALGEDVAMPALVRLAKALGAESGKALTEAEQANVLSGLTAKGEALDVLTWRQAISHARTPIGYVDFTFSADKSVSLAWAFAPTEAERNLIAQAHREAVYATMLDVAESIGQARMGQGGKDGAEKGAIGWITFDHYAARPTLEIARTNPDGTVETELVTVKVAGDPQLHTHVAVPNVVITPGGRVGSLDTIQMHRRIHEWGAIYQAHLARNLRAHGAEVGLDETLGAARLTAIPEAVRAAFSKRTRDAVADAKAYARSVGTNWELMSPDERIRLLKGGAFASRTAKGDDLSDFASWQRQAAALGYRHGSVLDPSRLARGLKEHERLERAYEAGSRMLAHDFGRRAVIKEADARIAAARGLIASGIDSAADVEMVRRAFTQRGIVDSGVAPHDGAAARTTLIAVPITIPDRHNEGVEITEDRLTTRAHVAQESALIELARKHGRDRRGLLTPPEIKRAVEASGLDFSGEHGRAQLRLINHLGMSGRFAAAIGAAGAGKTTLLKPLVTAWHAKGADVHGISLAWRQARDMLGAGLKPDAGDTFAAVSVFLQRAQSGRLPLTHKSVVVIDELATIGARQVLQLLRLQELHGFRMVMIGDPKQCQAIEAGFVTGLIEKALGKIATIETTVRQTDPRAREITNLLRHGEAATALEMKRQDGAAEIVPGGYRDVVARTAELWHERQAANANRRGYTLTVSTPTNDDARAIGEAIRVRLQAAGELGRNRRVLEATDPNAGADYKLPLAIGDRVRLFSRTNASLGDGRAGVIGDNGSILEVRSIRPTGLVLRNEKGTEGLVRWETLADPRTGRMLLTYGYATTTNTAQGATSTEHLFVTPAGSQATDGHKTYVSGSRHRERDYWLTSEGAEKQEVVNRRPLGDPRPVREPDLWMNWARNINRRPEKLNATDIVTEADRARRATAWHFLEGLARHEAKLESSARRDELLGKFLDGRARLQAREEYSFTRGFEVARQHRQGIIERLAETGDRVRRMVTHQLGRASPMLARAGADLQRRLAHALRRESPRTVRDSAAHEPDQRLSRDYDQGLSL